MNYHIRFYMHLYRAGDTGRAGEGHPPSPPPPFFLCSKKKKGRQREKRKTFKPETIKRLSPRSKCYCFCHSRASRIQKIYLVGQPWWPTILLSVPWSLHFEIHFAGPIRLNAYYLNVFLT